MSEYLRQKNGFLAVSHDREFIDAVSDHILAINKTNITLEKGNYTSWKGNVEKQEFFECRTKTRLENFTFGYGKTLLFEELTMNISKGERIWIKGPMAAEKVHF